MMLVGFVWAALAPLSLVLLVVLLQRALRARVRGAAWPMALALVLGPVGTRWWLDRREFVAVCRTAGAPVIHRRVAAEGIYLNSGTANSFGMRYLHDEGFAWVEAENIARRGAWVRYARRASAAGQTAEITTTEIPVLTARYEVRESFRQPLPHTGLA
ncbi:MAG: hypothetical protein MUF53_11475, partial [Gemmatimonadaceae bacterium]|nr:hypothetical protein [Gemmatimonadaceae bacterium]